MIRASGTSLRRQLVEDRLDAERLGDDPLLGLLEPVGREVMRREPERQALGAVEPRAGQREELRKPAAQPRQIAPAADVRENADRRLGHRQNGPLGRDAEAARAGDSDAAAHRHRRP